jgi:hypothetical protein
MCFSFAREYVLAIKDPQRRPPLPTMLMCNNRTRLERCSSVKCAYFPDIFFVLGISEFLDFVHCLVFQEHSALKSGAFCVFSKYKMMDEAQKLSNPK